MAWRWRYDPRVRTALVVYVAGVLVGLWKVDGPMAARVGLSAVWPLGVLALLVTAPILIVAGLVLFPVVGVAVTAAGVLGWWVWG